MDPNNPLFSSNPNYPLTSSNPFVIRGMATIGSGLPSAAGGSNRGGGMAHPNIGVQPGGMTGPTFNNPYAFAGGAPTMGFGLPPTAGRPMPSILNGQNRYPDLREPGIGDSISSAGGPRNYPRVSSRAPQTPSRAPEPSRRPGTQADRQSRFDDHRTSGPRQDTLPRGRAPSRAPTRARAPSMSGPRIWELPDNEVRANPRPPTVAASRRSRSVSQAPQRQDWAYTSGQASRRDATRQGSNNDRALQRQPSRYESDRGSLRAQTQANTYYNGGSAQRQPSAYNNDRASQRGRSQVGSAYDNCQQSNRATNMPAERPRSPGIDSYHTMQITE